MTDESPELRVVNAGRAARGAEPLAALPSFREPISDEDRALADRIADEVFRQRPTDKRAPMDRSEPTEKRAPATTSESPTKGADGIKATEQVERAEAVENAEKLERALQRERPDGDERAVQMETTGEQERAVQTESADKLERDAVLTGGRDVVPKTWAETMTRLAYVFGGDERGAAEAREWVRDAISAKWGVESVGDLPRPVRSLALQKTITTLLRIEDEGEILFDAMLRSIVAAIFARFWDGVVLDGPPWRISPTETDLPTYDEWKGLSSFF